MVADIIFAMLKHQAAGLGAALRAAAQGLLVAEVGQLAIGLAGFVVAKVEFELVVFGFLVQLQDDFGRERPARFGAKAVQRADFFVAHELLDFGQLKGAPRRRFAKGKAAALFAAAGAGAGVAAVVFFDDAATVRAGRLQGGVVSRDGVAVVFLGFFDHALGHGGDLGHKGFAPHLALLHQGELVFPLAGEFGFGQLFHPQAAQERHELKGFGRRDQLAPLAQHVFLVEQALDDGRARGRGAQAFFAHGFAEFFVFDSFARAFHGAKQRGLGVARRRAGFEAFGLGAVGAHFFAGLHGHQVLAFVAVFGVVHLGGGLFAVNGQPAGLDQHAAGGFELVALGTQCHGADAGGHLVFRSRVEHGNKAAHHKVVELLLGVGQAAGRLQRGDDGKVIAHLAVVKDFAAGLDVVLADGGARKRGQMAHAALGDHGHGLVHRGQVVLGQVARIGTRVGQGFVPLVQALRQRQRGFGRKAKAAIGLALQSGQVKQAGAAFVARLGLLVHGGGLAAYGVGNGLGLCLRPQAVFFFLGVVGVFFVRGVKPFGGVSARLRGKFGVDLKVIAADEFADLLLALDHHRQRGRLHPAHGGEEKAAVARVKSRHGARAVDAHQPVGLGAAARRVGQGLHLGIGAQMGKAVADGLRRHGLQPQAADWLAQRLGATGVLLNETENQFALAPGVAGVDQGAHVFALGQFDHRVQARFGFVHGL